MSTHALISRTDETTATRLAEAMDNFKPMPDAVALFEVNEEKAEWQVSVYFQNAPSEKEVRAFLEGYGLEKAPFAIEELPKEDWVAKGLEGLRPVKGGRYTLFGSHDEDIVPPNFFNIEVEAGQAFGTGHHGTTRGCLYLIDDILRKNHPRRVLDMGTGTGVLAIAVAKTLRQPVIASDIDLISVMVTEENATKNNVSNLIHAVEAVGFNHPQLLKAAPYDFIIANILPGPLMALCPDMRKHTAPGSFVLLSGILEPQAARVIATYRSYGFILKRRILMDGWVSLVLEAS